MGYNNYGMGGMGGMGRGQGGGMEMMMSVVCCVCCVSLLCIFAGYYFNLFCGVSKSMGKSCPADQETLPPYDPLLDTTAPVNTYSTNMCNPTYQGQSRAANDPRPPINAAACTGQTRVTGRDCFYYAVQPDPMSGLARWVRVADEPGKADAKNAACTPVVNCPVVIDFAATDMAGYRDNNAAPLSKKCTPVVAGGSTKTTMVPLITAAARSAGVQFNSVLWSNAHSTVWVNRMATALQGRNISAHIANTASAARTAKKKLNQQFISTQTFAAMLEAACYPITNQPDWISSVAVNSWAGLPSSAYLSEAGLVKYMGIVSKRNLQGWSTIINSPNMLRTG